MPITIQDPTQGSPQHEPRPQSLPGSQEQMKPAPVDDDPRYKGSGKLAGKVALITGGDSGIGRAVAIAFAKEGAHVAIIYLPQEEQDADATCQRLDQLGRRCLKIPGDVGDPEFCRAAVERIVDELGHLDILVNNAAEQKETQNLQQLTPEQLQQTFRTNLFGMYFLTQAALLHLADGAAIINTTSVNAYKPDPALIDYASTKAGILNFTRAMAQQLVPKKIRVNAVAPGPVWTPLIVASFSPRDIEEFGKDNPMKRAAQPAELAPSYVFLASNVDSGFITGQVLHVNGGSAMFS